MEFVPKDPIDNKSALVQVMAWRHIYATLGRDELSSLIM